MEQLLLNMLSNLSLMVDNKNSINNNQLIKDYGSLIYRIFPTKEIFDEIESIYKNGEISLSAKSFSNSVESISGKSAINSGNVGYKVYEFPKIGDKKKLKSVPAVVEQLQHESSKEEDSNEFEDDLLNTEDLSEEDFDKKSFYTELLNMDENQFIAHFGTKKLAVSFGQSIGVKIPSNAKTTEVVSLIQTALVDLI